MDSKNGYAAHYRELRVYALSRELSNEIFEFTKGFPREERYALTDQIRRSIGAQIAEAWGKRRYELHFISKMTDADAEQLETQHWVDVARDCKYLNEGEAESLSRKAMAIGKMIHHVIAKANTFCNPKKENREC
jgi:four helix bundle protein